MSVSGISFDYMNEIHNKSCDELKALEYDAVIKYGDRVSIEFLDNEIRRKENEELTKRLITLNEETSKLNEKMVLFTKWMVIMTGMVLVLTLINVLLAILE